MKKILFLLLSTIAMYGQVPADATQLENIQITNNAQDLTAEKVNVQDSNGVLNWQFISDFQTNKPYFSTGLIKNGLLSINADNTKFNLSAGEAVYSNFSDPDNIVSVKFNFPAFTAVTPTYLTTSNITYIAINYNNGTPIIVQQATDWTNAQKRDLVIIGAVVHSNFTNINTINNISSPSNDIGGSLADVAAVFGNLNLEGNVISANGANLQLNKSAGEIFKYGANFHLNSKNPHTVSLPSQTQATIRYRLQGGFEGTDRINIDPDNYDNNNVLTAVSNATPFTIQTIFIPQTGFIRLQYGQSQYNSLASAIAAINTRNFNVESNLKKQFVKIAYLIVKKGTTSLSAAVASGDAEIKLATKYDATASTGTALTLQAIVNALGYTPENVANKQNSLTVDGTGTKYPTVDAVNKRVNYVTPEQFGAVGDGITDDSAAMQSAVSSGKMVLLGAKTYLLNSTISINMPVTVNGCGDLSVLKSNLDISIFKIDSKNTTINSVTFAGSGKESGLTSQIGILVNDTIASHLLVTNSRFIDFGGSGYEATNHTNDVQQSTFTSCFFYNCNYGVKMYDEGEYNQFTACKIENSNFGFHNSAGNNSFIGGVIARNGTNVFIGTGINDAHSVMSGALIHSGVNYNIHTLNVARVYTFSGCVIYNGNVLIENSNYQFFNGNDISFQGKNLEIKNSIKTKFTNNHFYTQPILVVTGEAPLYFGNTYGIGSPDASVTSILTNEIFAVGQNLGVGTREASILGVSSTFKSINLKGPTTASIQVEGISSGGTIHLGSGGAKQLSLNGLPTSSSINSPTNTLSFIVGGAVRGRIYSATGNFALGNIADNNIDRAIVDGTISATSPATLPTQLIRKGEFDTSLGLKADLASPAFTGVPTAPTATAGTNTTQIATTAFVQSNSRPYKVYAALLTQSGTDAPVATVLENTLGGTVVWSRASTGIYIGTLAGVFTSNKVAIFVSGGSTSNMSEFRGGHQNSVNDIYLKTSLFTSALSDNLLASSSLEIRVYN